MQDTPTRVDAGADPKQWLLYKRDSCPYCRKVFAVLQELDAQVPMRDVGQDPQAKQELVNVGGKPQVPCLVIAGKPMYESDAIVAYLRRHLHRRPS